MNKFVIIFAIPVLMFAMTGCGKKPEEITAELSYSFTIDNVEVSGVATKAAYVESEAEKVLQAIQFSEPL